MSATSSQRAEELRFAERLKRYRAAHGLTQAQAAHHLGISLRTLQNWEINRNAPRGYGLNALLLLFDQTPAAGLRSAPAARPVPAPQTQAQPVVAAERFDGLSETHLL